jgi:hypothetical protein
MTEDDRVILRGCLQLLAFPFFLMWGALVLLPFLVLRKVVRWYRLPQHERDAINARERAKRLRDYEQLEAIIQAELRAHRLMDTPENRVRIKSAIQKRLHEHLVGRTIAR